VTEHQILQSLPSIALAVVAAFCFAGAAVLQHRAVSADPGSSTLSLRGLRDVTRRPGWLLGLVLAAGGSLLHAVALVLAPLSVVQPVGVLAVPIAVVLTAARTRRRPTPGMLVGVLVSVTAVVTFVGTAAGSAVSTPAPGRATLLAGVVVGLVVLVLAGVGLARTGWARCVACAMAGAAAFGLVSALVRAVSQAVTSGQIGILDPAVVATVAGVAAAILTGGWLIQQAFAAGPPEVVVACLTVVDPIVAVLFGVVLLGEGNATPPAHWAILIPAALAAAAGVAVLARHHPEATTRAAERARIRAAQIPRSHRR
jgi:drug/metabolite transporter (DMT)-like permease